MQGHLAAFALDPLICSGDVEILYVVDDPTIEDDVVRWLHNHASYLSFSIRTVCLRQNMGFGMACNIGVQAARANVVVLMNSDVFPVSKGWIDVLQMRLQADPDALVAPMLLYDSGLLQHFGMHVGFDGSQTNPIPCNFHSLKGLHRLSCSWTMLWRNSGATSCFRSCAGFSKGYLSYAGFDPIFGRGDFEDLELSLRWKRLSGPLFQVVRLFMSS